MLQGENALPQEKKDDQKSVDAQLIKSIECVPELKAYLGARFSLKDGMKPHELVFWKKNVGSFLSSYFLIVLCLNFILADALF